MEGIFQFASKSEMIGILSRAQIHTLVLTCTHTQTQTQCQTHNTHTPISMEKTLHLNPARKKINNNKKETHNAKKRQIWVKNMGQQ